MVDAGAGRSFGRFRTRCFREALRAERHVQHGHSLATFAWTAPPQEDNPSLDGVYALARLAVDAARRFEGRKNAGQSAQRLAAIVALLGPDRDIRTLRLRHFERAASDLRASGKSPKTINRYMAAISGAMKWAYRNELVEKQPPIPWEPEGQGRIAFVPAGSDTKLVSWMMEQGRHRQALLYEVLVSTGLRMGELQSLTPQTIQGEWVRLSDTKNGDCRDVPIAPDLGQRLRAMLISGTMPSRRTIAETFVAAGQAVGLEVRMTPHVLRHTAATRLNDAGVPTATIKQFLGHRSLRTTLQYAHVTKASLQEAGKLLRQG